MNQDVLKARFQSGDVLIRHSANIKGKPRITVVGVKRTDNNGVPSVFFGVSKCSNKDTFIKRIGAIKAFGRAMSREKYEDYLQTGQLERKDFLTTFLDMSSFLINEFGGEVKQSKKRN